MRTGVLLKRHTLALVGVAVVSVVIAGCGGGGGSSASAEESVATTTQVVAAGELSEVEGRAVSATADELVLRTAEGERTFRISPEDEQAVDPAHVDSHVGIPTLGFRIYYRTVEGVDYAVSAEEIPASSLGFD